MNIAVVGMGKIGLPLAVQYAKKGNTVLGIDINPKTIELINQGLEPFPEEAHLKEYLADVVSRGLLKATLDYAEGVKNADVVVVVVPLFVNDEAEPEFSAMDQATALIGTNLKKGSLICYETTLPIGITRTRFVPSLEKQSGLKVGVDFNVVFSPERVFTGRIFEDLRKYPKIVGGITQECTNKGVNFYTQVIDFDKREDLTKPNGVWAVESTESAEFVKLAETTYRDVNIALANQFAIYADSIGQNIFEIIESANSQNYSNLHQPGISVGGHCIPIYPQFFLWNSPASNLIRESRIINLEMPKYCIEEIKNILGNIKGLKFLVSGVSYRTGVKETAFSGAYEINRLLEAEGAHAVFYDDLFNREEINEIGLNAFEDSLENIDCVIMHNDSSVMKKIFTEKYEKIQLVYLGRNMMIDPERMYIYKVSGLGQSYE
jgi:UDP-N-acetyl-D-glucosamine dehydrogenase